MKRILTILLAALALPVLAQHNRLVLVEEFTNASCAPCAANNPAFNTTLQANDQFIAPIKYQVWWPGVDPMYNQTFEDVNPRVAYYGVSGVPDGFENGVTFPGAVGAYSQASIDNAWNNLTPVTINVTHSLSADYSTVNIEVSVTSDADLSGNLHLRTAVVENTVNFTAAPGTNGEKEFFNVMRKMLPNHDGTLTGDFIAGETKTYTFSWEIKNYYDLNQLEVIAWLQDDDSQDIWQAGRSKPNTVIPGGNYAKIQLGTLAQYKLTCGNTSDPLFVLKNVGTDTLTSASFRYRVDNEAWQTYDWAGSLKPNLTTSVTLPTVTFTTSGNHSIVIQVLSTNSGLQTNQVDGAGTMKVNSMFIASTPPAVSDFEAAFPPTSWGIKNEANGDGWTWRTDVGGYDNSSSSAFINFYSIAAGKKVELLLPKLDLSQAAGVTTLAFDHAYTYYDATYQDRMQVEVSTNCGTSWTSLFNKAGADLATAPAQTTVFSPSADEWITNEIDLSTYNGQAELLVRFKGTTGFGNSFFLDNVNLSTVSGVKTLTSLSEFKIQPNPARDAAELRFTLQSPESIRMMVYSVEGALVQSQELGDLPAGLHTVALDPTRLPAGSYRVALQGKEGVAQQQWVVLK